MMMRERVRYGRQLSASGDIANEGRDGLSSSDSVLPVGSRVAATPAGMPDPDEICQPVARGRRLVILLGAGVTMTVITAAAEALPGAGQGSRHHLPTPAVSTRSSSPSSNPDPTPRRTRPDRSFPVPRGFGRRPAGRWAACRRDQIRTAPAWIGPFTA